MVKRIGAKPGNSFFSSICFGIVDRHCALSVGYQYHGNGIHRQNHQQPKKVLWSGVLYTFGRMFSYTAIGAIIYFGANTFQIAKLFQGNGEKYIGFVLVILGLIMLDTIKLNFIKGGNWIEQLSDKFKTKGLLGAFLLGALFAFAFCPYSGVLFFGMLVPMTIKSGLAMPILFSIGTGLPVILFAFVIAFSMEKLGMYFKAITKIEKIMRIFSGLTFIVTGLYYINIYFKFI